MMTFRTNVLRIASGLSHGDPTRRKILSALAGNTAAALTVRDLADRSIGPFRSLKFKKTPAGTVMLRGTRPMIGPITMAAAEEPPTGSNLVEKDQEWRSDGFANRLYMALLDVDVTMRLSGGVTAVFGQTFKPDMDSHAVGVQGKPLKVYPWVEFDGEGADGPSLTEGDVKKLEKGAERLQAKTVKVVKEFRDRFAPIWGVVVKARV